MCRTKPSARSARGGFTLVEVLVSVAISAIILTGIMTTFVMLGRSAYNAGSYSIMESQSRRALETFSQDARNASNITSYSSTSVTLAVDSLSGTSTVTTSVTYAYNSSQKTFSRTSGGTTLVLVRNVSDFSFHAFKVVNGVDFTATVPLEMKQLQITLRTRTSRNTTADTTNAVLSARVVLRNKPVTT